MSSEHVDKSEVPEIVDKSEAPKIDDKSEAPEIVDKSEAPEIVDKSEAPEILEVIREEHSPALSSVDINDPNENIPEIEPCKDCTCLERDEKLKEMMDPELVQTLLREKEKRLTEEFQEQLKMEVNYLKDSCAFILQNEQIRASYMLREAHRERQEKITALQTQLECKNLAGLMYVLCSERRKSQLEKLRLKEEYTNYILVLQDILTDAQALILHLSKGYKTASRVDHEWREKMRNVLKEFQMFVHDFAGGSPESNQYFFDVPAMLKTTAPIVDNPIEDPCDSEVDQEEENDAGEKEDGSLEGVTVDGEKPWWERVSSGCRPFLMFGDMAEFKPPQRREVLHAVKVAKTAPRKWKEYVCNEMFINANCAHADVIKDEYPKHLPDDKWVCEGRPDQRETSKTSLAKPRAARVSEDVRGNMGSILKIVTSKKNVTSKSVTKSMLLGARDSMEIQSTTKLREKHAKKTGFSKAAMGASASSNKRASFADQVDEESIDDFGDLPDIARRSKIDEDDIEEPAVLSISRRLKIGDDDIEEPAVLGRRSKLDDDDIEKPAVLKISRRSKLDDDDIEEPAVLKIRRSKIDDDDIEEPAVLGSIHTDSLQVLNHHVPDRDHKIHYEKVCPVEKCRRLQVDSFTRALPSYMRSSPYMYFEQNYEDYETCSPEQIEILKKRIEEKKAKFEHEDVEPTPLDEWTPSVEGIAVQTSELSLSLPPCCCRVPSPTPVSSDGRMFNVRDLIPMKQAIDLINTECLFDDRIQFNRFKVLGQESKTSIARQPRRDSNRSKVQGITKVLRQHPSLLDIFQANTKC